MSVSLVPYARKYLSNLNYQTLPVIHQIVHKNKLIQKKVNFFADYFEFVKSNIGLYDDLEIENYLSLTKKALFQIEKNSEHCPKYLDSYFSHPMLKKDNQYFKEFKSYQCLQPLIQEYNKPRKSSDKKKWIKENNQFYACLSFFKKELTRGMFKDALNSIVSFLKCPHDVDEHIDDLKFYTRVLVSELLLNNRTKEDLENVFERIMTEKIGLFPFPKKITKNQEDKSLVEAQQEYMSNRTFNEQFKGIYYILKEKVRKSHFLFRIIGIDADSGFHFKYNKVTFYHPNHPKLAEIRKGYNSKAIPYPEDFFGITPMLIAAVKVNHQSTKIAEQEAINTIEEELVFLNYTCNANAHIEKYYFLTTPDFKKIGYRIDVSGKRRTIGESSEKRLKNNPYVFLKNANKECYKHFLEYEPLFVKAMASQGMPDYWHYLEALIPLKGNSEKQVIGTISTILVLNAEGINKSRLRNYISYAIMPFNASSEEIGITKEKQMHYYNQDGTNEKLDFQTLSKEVTHPLLSSLLKVYVKPYTKSKLKATKEYYSRLLWELQAQRNSIVHSGYGNEDALVLLNGSIPYLITRFRWILFSEMKKNNDASFEALITRLRKEADTKLGL